MNNKNKVTLLIFVILLAGISIVPIVQAQTPTPPITREELIQKIQLRAQKDVDLGATLQTPSDLAVLFGNEADTVGMSMNEVKDIYDEAYQAATPEKSPWDDLLKPQGGWIFLIIGGLLVILANIAKDYLTTFFKKLAELAYQRLARYRPFWMIALRRYRKSLESAYSELKIPFRAGRPLQMKDVYVPVRVEGGDKQQVDAYQTIQNQKRLVVLGDPGSGKTMLLRHIAFTYAQQGLYDFLGQPIPLYLELNRVESAGNSLLDALTKTLENHNFPGADGFLKSQLEKQSLLILLDGLDEVNMQARPALVNQVQDLDQKHPGNRIIVTCRKAVYQGEMDSWVDQKMEVVDFNDQQIQRFMTSWQKDMPLEKSIEHFFRTLQERPQIMALARNPLLLTMVAYLYTDTEFALPHSRSEFYSRSTDLLLDQWKLERNRYKASNKRTVLQKLALFNQSQAGKTGERRTLELADVLREIRDVLPDLTLKTEDAHPLMDEIVQRSGLMLAIDGGTRYQFTHLTLQEYFAARALQDDQKGLLDFYRTTPDAWREVVRLWCALEHDSTAMLKELYALDPVIAFECLSDAQQVDNAYADELIENFKPRLHEALKNDSLASAFALLAADPRPRGKKWFEFIASKMNDKENRLAACTALARTNIPQAAVPLVKLAATEYDVVSFLVQLGNLAVPALTEPAQKGEIWAIDTLVDIGTPQAALVLQPLLWTGESKAYHAAWRLAAIISLSGVEDVLQSVTLTSEQRKAKQIEWIWEPFSESITLRTIVGRIVYLIDTTLEEYLPEKSLFCDPRLALSICAVSKNVYQNLDENNRKKIRKQIVEAEIPLPTLDNLGLNHSKPEDEKQKMIVDEFSSQLKKDKVLHSLYSALPAATKFDLLHRLVFRNVSPSEDDWRNLRKPVNFDFSKSWHVKIIKILISTLVLFNLVGIGFSVNESNVVLSWANASASILGLLLTLGIVFIYPKKWDLQSVELTAIILGMGLGIGFESIVIKFTHNSNAGILLGILCNLSFFALYLAAISSFKFFQDIRSNHIYIGLLFGSVIGNISIGYLTTTLLGVLGSVLGGMSFSILGFLALFLMRIKDSEKSFLSNIEKKIGAPLTGTLVGFLISTLVGAPVLGITYYATNLLYSLIGWQVAAIFWLIWFATFFFLLFLVERLERRAMNPLHGLLEASPSANRKGGKQTLSRILGWKQT